MIVAWEEETSTQQYKNTNALINSKGYLALNKNEKSSTAQLIAQIKQEFGQLTLDINTQQDKDESLDRFDSTKVI